MPIQKLQAVVIANVGNSIQCEIGQKRFTERVCGQEIILYPTTLLEKMNIPTTVIIGDQKDKIKRIITQHHGNTINCVLTEKEEEGIHFDTLYSYINTEKPFIFIMKGNIPLISHEIIEKLYKKHEESNATISFIIAHNTDPSIHAYDRVCKKDNNLYIVSSKEFNGDPYEHCCVNAGIYIVNRDFLKENYNSEKNNIHKKFGIIDMLKIAHEKQCIITAISVPFDNVRRINNFQDLWTVEQIKRGELIKYWMNRGVHFSVAQNVHIDLDVSLGEGTHIGCSVHIVQGTQIGKNCSIYGFSALVNTIVKDNTIVYPHCVIKDAEIGSNAYIGPFAHIHEYSKIEDGVTIGNFVEVKRSVIEKETKAKHLSYLGDSHIGTHVNIGAGTITCNHNGISKHQTTIEDDAYIGSNNTLIAPVTIGKNAFTAAGSVITHTVPKDALAIGRSRQVNKEGYAKKLKQRAASPPSFIATAKTKNNPNQKENV